MLDELDLVAAEDPAADLHPDPTDVRARAMRDHIVAGDVDRPQRTGPRRRRRRALVVAVASLSIVTGAAAIAERGPFAGLQEACQPPDGRDYVYPECGDFIIDDVMADIQRDGTAIERQVLADGEVTRVEYDEAARRTVVCIQNGLDEVVDGAVATATNQSWRLGFRHSFRIVYPPDVAISDLPWEDATPATTGDESGPQPMRSVTDAMIQRNPSLRCTAENYDLIDRVWEAQQIANQND